MRIHVGRDEDENSRMTALEQEPIRPETALESILHQNPHLIADEPLLIIGRQVQLDSGVADLVACDEYGNLVIVEVKIGRSGIGSASEGSILSQPQEYASSLSRYEYDALADLYQEYCTRLEDGEWDVARATAASGILRQGFKSTFEKEIADHQFNTEQRLIVVAEEITQSTAANARFLLEQGLHFQCSEVRCFSAPEDTTGEQTLLVSSMVVDYDVSRVQPAGRSSPTYPDLAGEILERAFPEFRSLVQADSLFELLPDGIDGRQQQLISDNPNHPESVVYRLDVKPDAESLLIGIDIPGGGNQEDVLGQIESNSEVFTENGFTVKGNPMYRVVVDEWDVKSADQVRNLMYEVAERYATLINLGHSTLADPE